MRYVKSINEWFSKPKDGDTIASKILDIVNNENINIIHNGGYRIDIDDNIYSFSNYGGLFSNSYMSVYDKSQEVIVQKYGKIIRGESKAKYEISKKIWNELEKIYNKQQHKKNINILATNLDELSDESRSANKFNL